MFDLPKETEINLRISKAKLFGISALRTSEKKLLDNTISNIHVVNQISAHTIPSLNCDGKIQSINVLLIEAKLKPAKNFFDLVFKSINQILVLVLNVNDNYTIAAKYDDIVLTRELLENKSIILLGNNLDEVYDNFIKDLFEIVVSNTKNVGEQIKINEKINNLQYKIRNLERIIDNEPQFNKKVKYNAEINRLKREIKELKC